ncbi:unnamed protein product [Closterium sp. NIES-54]
MVHQVLQRFGFQFSLPQPSPLSTSHSLSAPPADESVEPSGPYPELVGCLMYLMTCTRADLAYPLNLLACYVAPDRHQKVHWDAVKRVLRYLCSMSGMGLVLGRRGPVVLTGHADASWVDGSATQRSSQGYTFSLGSSSASWRSTHSSSILSSSCEAEIYAGAMAAQVLRWLTNLLTDLGEQPRSPPVLYVNNKAMIALCQEHRLEHRTKHIALRYFLARELQQRGQLRLAYVATRANTADISTKALSRGDHQRFSTVLGLTCGKPHTQHRCFSRLDDAWRAEFCDEVEHPHWAELLRYGVAIFDLDYDAIPSAMYALSASAEGDCYRCVPPDPGIEAAALGASEASLPGTAPTEALHTFTLDSSASRCFFRDSTTLTPLLAPVSVRLADPSGGPDVARSSIVLPCLAVPSGSLSGLHLPLFSMKSVSTAALKDVMVTTTTPGGQRVSICTCTRTGRHLATFTPQPGSSLYTLATEPPQVAASSHVSASGQVAPPCSCHLLSHQTLLWHHRIGHPSLPRLRGMHSRLLISGLPMSLPPLPPLPAPPRLPCIERRQRAAPHSSFPPTTAPLQTLHMNMWGTAHVSGQGHKRYFLLVVDDYTWYTTVFPLRCKGQVVDVLIPWIRAVRLQLHERFHQDLSVVHLHSDRGGEFFSDLLRDFCRGEGILQSFTLLASPQQNGIAERCIGLDMETSPTLRWTGEFGDASLFRVWGSRAFVRDTSADKLSPRAIPCVFLGFPPDAPGWQFYHPTSRRVFPSQEVTFDESVPFYRLFPYRSAPSPPSPLFLAPGAARGAASGGAEPGGAEPGGVEPGGVEPGGAESQGAGSGGGELGGAELESVEPGDAESEGAESGVLSLGVLLRLESGAARAGGTTDTGAGGARVTAGAGVTGGTMAARPGGARTTETGAAGTGGVGGAGAGDRTEPGAAGVGGAGAGGTGAGAGAGGVGAGGSGAGGAGAGGAGAFDPGAGGAGTGGAGCTGAEGTVRLRPYFVPLVQQVLGVPSSTSLTPPLLCPPPDQSQLPLQPASPLPAPSPYTEQSGGLTERCELASRPVSPFRTTRRVPCSLPPLVPGTHAMALCHSSVPLRVPLPPPPESSLPIFLDPRSDLVRAASPTVSRLLTTVVTDPSFESTAASALVAELLDFATTCRLDYATTPVAES